MAALLLVVFAPACADDQAAAAKPCWRLVLDDWTDNTRLDKKYPVGCYNQALKNIPEDVRDYTDAFDQISNARQAALRGDDRGLSAVGANSGDDDPGGSDGGIIDDVLGAGSGSSDSIPLPLLILGGLAALLMAAGAAGLLARRLQSRRLGPPEPPE